MKANDKFQPEMHKKLVEYTQGPLLDKKTSEVIDLAAQEMLDDLYITIKREMGRYINSDHFAKRLRLRFDESLNTLFDDEIAISIEDGDLEDRVKSEFSSQFESAVSSLVKRQIDQAIEEIKSRIGGG